MKYTYCKFFVDQCIKPLNEDDARQLFNTGSSYLYIVDNTVSTKVILQIEDGESRKGIGDNPDNSQWNLIFRDENGGQIFQCFYTNIHRFVDGNPSRFYMVQAITKEIDENNELHGQVPLFSFTQLERIWHKPKSKGIKKEIWNINEQILFQDEYFSHGELLQRFDYVPIDFNFDPNELWVEVKFGEWDKLVNHAKKILPYLHDLRKANAQS